MNKGLKKEKLYVTNDFSKGVVGTKCDEVNSKEEISGLILNGETYL